VGLLRLLAYLSPGLPLAPFGAVADHLRRCPELGSHRIALASGERVSGPDRGSVDRSEDPFSRGEADVGFLCAPTYLRPTSDCEEGASIRPQNSWASRRCS
jgi:hypothetical protein